MKPASRASLFLLSALQPFSHSGFVCRFAPIRTDSHRFAPNRTILAHLFTRNRHRLATACRSRPEAGAMPRLEVTKLPVTIDVLNDALASYAPGLASAINELPLDL